jgi:K+-sensing histidine kinase KdpD
MPRSFSGRLALSLGSLFAYLSVFFPLYSYLARAAIAFCIVPILVVANAFGLWGGLIAGLASMALNSVLFLLCGEPSFAAFAGKNFWISHAVFLVVGIVTGHMRDLRSRLQEELNARQQAEEEREKAIQQLQTALAEVKTLSGLLPMCSGCKKIRNDQGYWQQIESYLMDHSDAKLSHGLCPECMEMLNPEFSDDS